MVFDPTKPEAGTDGVSEELRDNFNALAAHHVGASAPPAAALGFIWIDTATVSNVKLKAHNGTGWVVIAEHLESTPVPATVAGVTGVLADAQNADQLQGRAVAATAPAASQVLTWSGSAWAPADAGGGGTFTRGVVTGGYDQAARYAKNLIDIAGFPNDAIITRLMIWPTPIGGGQFSSELAPSWSWRLLPKDDGVATADGDNALLIGFNVLDLGIRKLKAAAVQGSTTVTFNGALTTDVTRPIMLYDGVTPEFHNWYYSYGSIVSGTYGNYLHEPIAKVGGFTSADYAVAPFATQGLYSNLVDDGELHVLAMRFGATAFHMNYRINYLYMA